MLRPAQRDPPSHPFETPVGQTPSTVPLLANQSMSLIFAAATDLDSIPGNHLHIVTGAGPGYGPWVVTLIENHFTRAHGYIALGFLIVFGGFTLFVVGQPKNHEGLTNIVITTLATVSGPMVGAVARECQSCCLRFSLSLLPWSGTFLAIGVLFQMVRLPFERFATTLRLTLWCVGLLAWFGSGLVSFGHAFS